MIKTVVIAIALALLAAPVSAAQKNKGKLKEKRFEAVVRQEASEYAGRYVGIDESYTLEIEVGEGNQLRITSIEGSRRAELRDIKLEGALLMATKVYEDGTTARFEGLFANRILNGERTFGVVVSGLNIQIEGLTITRTFYRLFTGERRK